MTLTLILIRHAKSDWGALDLSDHDRPLNARGKNAAPRIGAWLAEQGLVPDMALCSTARRTQETWALIAGALPKTLKPTLLPALYNASGAQILRCIEKAQGRTVAVIGHNPGLGTLAHDLAETAPEHPKFGLYPTGATTVLNFATSDWREIIPGAGHVAAFTVPRDLDPA